MINTNFSVNNQLFASAELGAALDRFETRISYLCQDWQNWYNDYWWAIESAAYWFETAQAEPLFAPLHIEKFDLWLEEAYRLQCEADQMWSKEYAQAA